MQLSRTPALLPYPLYALIEYFRLHIENLWNAVDLKRQSIAIH
jgi:hypothetical protein